MNLVFEYVSVILLPSAVEQGDMKEIAPDILRRWRSRLPLRDFP